MSNELLEIREGGVHGTRPNAAEAIERPGLCQRANETASAWSRAFRGPP